jgi:broad specificity phosphatase PhoE
LTNSLYFLRHAESKVDLAVPARDWSITPNGAKLTRDLANSQKLSVIDGIIHSSETKARQTAEIFAEGLEVQMYQLSGLDELVREHGGTLTNEEYRNRVRQTLTDWDGSIPGWESGASALERFEDSVKKIDIMFHRKNVLIVSHGIVLTIYFCKLKGLESIAFERWSQLEFLSWGLVRDGRVLVDLI